MPYFAFAACTVAAALGIWIRWHYVDRQGFWYDEIYTVASVRGFDIYLFPGSDIAPIEAPQSPEAIRARLAADGFWTHLQRNMIHEDSPPVYFAAARAWTDVFGLSFHALRMLSVVSSIALICVVAAALYFLDSTATAIVGGALSAVSPFAMYYAHESRNYSLGLFVLATSGALITLAYRRAVLTRAMAATLGMLASIAAMTHYYLYLDALIMGGVVVLLGGRTLPLRWRLLPVFAPTVAILSWAPILLAQASKHHGTHWTNGTLPISAIPRALATTVTELLIGPHITHARIAYAGAATLVLLATYLLRASSRTRNITTILLLWICLRLGAVCAIDALVGHHTIAIPRYSFGILLPLLAIAALATTHTRLGYKILPFALLGLAAASFATATAQRAPRQMLREAAGYLNVHSAPGDHVVVVPSGPTLVGLAWYLTAPVDIGAVPPSGVSDAIQAASSQQHATWFAIQRLGVSSQEATVSTEETGGIPLGEPVRFVALDLFRVAGRSDQK